MCLNPIEYHKVQLPSLFVKTRIRFFYEQVSFYEEIEIISFISNGLLEYDGLGCPPELENESDYPDSGELGITLLK